MVNASSSSTVKMTRWWSVIACDSVFSSDGELSVFVTSSKTMSLLVVKVMEGLVVSVGVDAIVGELRVFWRSGNGG